MLVAELDPQNAAVYINSTARMVATNDLPLSERLGFFRSKVDARQS